MSNGKTFSLYWLILNLAVGAMLAVGGIWALQGGGDFACSAIREIFDSDVEKILVLVFGVIELLSGIFILLQLLIGDRTGNFGTILKLIVVIVWVVAIVLADFFGKNGILNNGLDHFLRWIYNFAMHLIVLGALLVTRD